MIRSKRRITESTLRTYIRSILLEYPQDICPKCGSDRSKTPGKKFCGKCGAKMGLCPKCEKPLGDNPKQKFCTKCGEKLATHDSGGAAGEQKQDVSDKKEVKKEFQEVLSEAEKLLKELENALTKAPNESSKEEKRLYDQIMGPYFEEQDRMLEVEPETPQEARAHLKKSGDHIRKFKPTLIKMYKAVKGEGKVLSKPMLELLITSVKREVEHAKATASQAAANKKRLDDSKAEHEKRMAAMNAEFEKKMAALNDEIYKQNPKQKMIDDALGSSKK